MRALLLVLILLLPIAGIGQDEADVVLVGTVTRVVNGDSVGLTLVAKGYAWAYRQYLGDFEGDEDYCRAEADARSRQIGLWSLQPKDRRAPWEWRQRGKGKRYTNWEAETAVNCVAAIGK